MKKKKQHLEVIQKILAEQDFTVKSKRTIKHSLGYHRAGRMFQRDLVTTCASLGIVSIIGNDHIVFLNKPNGDEGIALELLMEAYLSKLEPRKKKCLN